MWCRARDDKDMAAWTQTLGRDYKTCIVKENLSAGSKGCRGVDDYPLLDCARSRLGIGGLGFTESKLRGGYIGCCFLTNATLGFWRLTDMSGC